MPRQASQGGSNRPQQQQFDISNIYVDGEPLQPDAPALPDAATLLELPFAPDDPITICAPNPNSTSTAGLTLVYVWDIIERGVTREQDYGFRAGTHKVATATADRSRVASATQVHAAMAYYFAAITREERRRERCLQRGIPYGPPDQDGHGGYSQATASRHTAAASSSPTDMIAKAAHHAAQNAERQRRFRERQREAARSALPSAMAEALQAPLGAERGAERGTE